MVESVHLRVCKHDNSNRCDRISIKFSGLMSFEEAYVIKIYGMDVYSSIFMDHHAGVALILVVYMVHLILL